MVKNVAELPKTMLEAFEIGRPSQNLCTEDYAYSFQLPVGALGPS